MKKCLVLDLDNTLWGGIVGEDGMENIQLSLSSPGNSFIAFQQAILDLYNKGIILAINSRNNPADAWNVIKNHPNMILKEKHFAANRINWKDKAENILEIAKELNIGLDSIVFLDDDETNREMVKAIIPEVTVPALPKDTREYTRFLNSLDYFNSEVITDEDKMRGNLYVTERLRKEEEKKHQNKDAFLKSLCLEMKIFVDDNACLPRLSQLTEKTNQFNILKNPISEEELSKLIASDSHKIIHAGLQDIFGDYGIIIFGIVEKKDKVWHIKSLLMSCRVFGRGVEDAFFAEIEKFAKNAEVEKITIDFKETEKNAPTKVFLDKYFKDNSRIITNQSYSPIWIKTIYGKI